jgi:hypothetical protein
MERSWNIVHPATDGGGEVSTLFLDFTGTADGFEAVSKVDGTFADLIRGDAKPQCIIVVDKAVSGAKNGPVVVRDHINLTGHSPLCGPNHPCGERFPVVQGIYREDALTNLPRVVAAGLVPGTKPTDDDVKTMKELGAEASCYNLVPAMLIAAHAKCKVVGVLVHDVVTPELAAQLKAVAEETK